ncbi:MAG: UDP-glucose/GDP-mannose dehydrogenase family protein [Saprospiraceae bacterium]
MNIAVVGTGYVGLVTGTCFAETGNHVICIDIDEEKVKQMQNGQVPIYEPGLELLFERNTKEGRLTFTTNLAEGIEEAEIIFLALPTPPGEDGSADLSYILNVAKDLSEIITDYKVIVDKSTVPVGTAEEVHSALVQKLDAKLFDVVSNPEFLREGLAVEDFMKPDRIIIGTSSERVKTVMRRLYEPFVRQGNPILFMDERSAEMTKYAANSFLATKISFMNEIANLCELTGAEVDWVRKGIGTDPRIGKRFLFPGVGYGGSCFPKDVKALIKTSEVNNYDFKILRSVVEVNSRQKQVMVEKIKKFYGTDDLSGKTIAVWGLSFKPNTDDIREASAITILNGLLELGAKIKAYDPEAMANIHKLFGNKIELVDDQYEALIDADALVIITEWHAFESPSFKVIKKLLKDKAIFDGRNLYNIEQMKELGFYYESIGRKVVNSKL